MIRHEGTDSSFGIEFGELTGKMTEPYRRAIGAECMASSATIASRSFPRIVTSPRYVEDRLPTWADNESCTSKDLHSVLSTRREIVKQRLRPRVGKSTLCFEIMVPTNVLDTYGDYAPDQAKAIIAAMELGYKVLVVPERSMDEVLQSADKVTRKLGGRQVGGAVLSMATYDRKLDIPSAPLSPPFVYTQTEPANVPGSPREFVYDDEWMCRIFTDLAETLREEALPPSVATHMFREMSS